MKKYYIRFAVCLTACVALAAFTLLPLITGCGIRPEASPSVPSTSLQTTAMPRQTGEAEVDFGDFSTVQTAPPVSEPKQTEAPAPSVQPTEGPSPSQPTGQSEPSQPQATENTEPVETEPTETQSTEPSSEPQTDSDGYYDKVIRP